MPEKLEFITDEKLKSSCSKVINAIKSGMLKAEADPYGNVIDPFSAIFEASYNKIPLTEWMNREKQRQAQKSWQNMIGSFHQELISHMEGFHDLGAGGVLDVKNDNLKIIAEVKNKFNTTKGNHNIAVYDDIAEMISRNEYGDYTGYYVKILTKNRFNKCFTPPDNRTKCRRPTNDQIREIDGKSFYTLVTGDNQAMKKLYEAVSRTLIEILEIDNKTLLTDDPFYNDLFDKAFL